MSSDVPTDPPPSPPAPPSLIGTTVGGYRLVTELGSGGMGTVYYAEHRLIGRRAAIKILHPHVSRDPQMVSRFFTEARAVNEIRHPNVVEITDIGQEGDTHFIVMSFLEGETVGQRLERDRKLDEAVAVHIVRQVAGALAAAHDRGVVHRDLKPENVFLQNHPDYPDYVRVLDFGIAKLIGAEQVPSHRTNMGSVLGTPAYMSPEQCRGRAELDHRSDVYSLGVVLYEMVTGQVPFRAENQMDVLVAHVHAKPRPPIELLATLSPHVNAAILRSLEKNADDRFASMRELREALDGMTAGAAVVTAGTGADAGVEAGAAGEGEAAAAADAPAGEETFEKREQREAAFVADKLTDIILRRLEADSLLVPAMPAVAARCMQLLDDPRQTFKDVGRLVSTDPMLAARVLRLANSAAFPGRTPATSLESAISRMGTEGLKIALVNYSMYQAFTSRDRRIQASFRGIWEHSLAVALIAKEIVERLPGGGASGGGVDASAAYLVGLLHDIGKPVVGALLLEAEKLVEGHRSALDWISHGVWKRVVDGSHRRVGVAFARKWKLPPEIGDAIETCVGYDTAKPRSCANVVCLANAVAKQHGLYSGDTVTGTVDEAVATGRKVLGLPEQALTEIGAQLYKRVGTLFDPKPAAGAAAPAGGGGGAGAATAVGGVVGAGKAARERNDTV